MDDETQSSQEHDAARVTEVAPDPAPTGDTANQDAPSELTGDEKDLNTSDLASDGDAVVGGLEEEDGATTNEA